MDKMQQYNLFDCIECGCCAHVCPSHIPLVHYYRFAKSTIWQQQTGKQKSDRARERHEARASRLERQEQERKERLRKKSETPPGKEAGADAAMDQKKAANEAAKQRAREKKAALVEAGIRPKNTDELAPAQQRQIEQADQRRAETASGEPQNTDGQ
jgi:electron transport complex protein RnfC